MALACTIRGDNSKPPTAGMEASWQGPSLWSRLQCDVMLLHEFSMSPPAKEVLGAGGLLNHRCLSVRMTQGLTTSKISYIFLNDRSTDKAGDGKQKDRVSLKLLAEIFPHQLSRAQRKKNNGKAGYRSLSTPLDPNTQVPIYQLIIVHIQTPKGRNTACLRQFQPDLMFGLLSMVRGTMDSPLLCAHLSGPHGNIHSSLQRTL